MDLPLGTRCLEHWGQANFPRGSTLNQGSMPALPLLPAWERPAASVFVFVLKTIEPSQGVSLKRDVAQSSAVFPELRHTQSSRYLTFSIALGLGGRSALARLLFCVSSIVSSTVQTLRSLCLCPRLLSIGWGDAVLHVVAQSLSSSISVVATGKWTRRGLLSCHHPFSPTPQLLSLTS